MLNKEPLIYSEVHSFNHFSNDQGRTTCLNFFYNTMSFLLPKRHYIFLLKLERVNMLPSLLLFQTMTPFCHKRTNLLRNDIGYSYNVSLFSCIWLEEKCQTVKTLMILTVKELKNYFTSNTNGEEVLTWMLRKKNKNKLKVNISHSDPFAGSVSCTWYASCLSSFPTVSKLECVNYFMPYSYAVGSY